MHRGRHVAADVQAPGQHEALRMAPGITSLLLLLVAVLTLWILWLL